MDLHIAVKKYVCVSIYFARQTNVYVTGELTMYECKSSSYPLQVNCHKHIYFMYIKMYIYFVQYNTFHWREFRNHFFGYCSIKGLYPNRSRWKHGRVDITIPVFALWSLERGMTLYRLTCVRKEKTNTLYRNSQSCQNEAWTELLLNGTEVGKNSLYGHISWNHLNLSTAWVDRGGVLNCQFGCSFVDLIPSTMFKTVFHVLFGSFIRKMGERNSQNLRNFSPREYKRFHSCMQILTNV